MLIRSDSTRADPRTSTGLAVLLHELGHAVGLGHAVQGADEIMAPVLDPDRAPALGQGDRWALRELGCTSAGWPPQGIGINNER